MDQSLLPALQKATSKVVRQASRPGGTLEQGVFTMSMARAEIERAMGLDEGVLGKGEWKGRVKGMVEDALDKVDNEPSSSQASSSKYPSPSRSPTPVSAKRSKTKTKSQRESSSSRSRKSRRSDSDEATDDYSEPRKKAKKSKRNRQDTKGKKVETESEEEEGIEEIESNHNDSQSQMSPPPTSKSTSTSTKRIPPKEDEEEEEPTKKKYVEKPQARMSDSDMSSVYDEAPSSKSRKPLAATKRKSKSKSVSVMSSSDEKPSSKKRKSVSKKKDPNEGLSPDEAKLADLKRIVVACGVRKQWAKEFADIPTTSSQIRHLQSLLSSLGMKGQPTLGKAKTLKEKRELAQELDDVKTFEAARGVSSDTRASRSRAGGKKKAVHSDDEEEAEEEAPIELDKEESALGAVLDLDFLGGDSDSD